MQSPYGTQGSLAVYVCIMISVHNTSLILVPFLLLREAAGPCTCQSAESKKAVSETHTEPKPAYCTFNQLCD